MKKSSEYTCAGGFTLVEFMVILALLILMAAFIVPYINLGHYNLRSAAFNLRTDMMKAKGEAARTNSKVRITFSPSGYTMVLDPDGNATVLKQVDLSGKHITIGDDYAGSVTFTPLGTANNGSVDLTGSGGDTFTIHTNSIGKIWIDPSGT